MTSVLEEDENAVGAMYMDATRGVFTSNPGVVLYSDWRDPAGIPEGHQLTTDDREEIRGLQPFMENMCVLTDKSLCVFTGKVGLLIKIAEGAGCVAHESIVVNQGRMYWLNYDGIYSWDGTTQPRKISGAIDALFTGRYGGMFHPTDLNETLERLGWPWTVEHSQLKYSNAVHYSEQNQIWWSISVRSRASRSFAVTLVYDYTGQVLEDPMSQGAWYFLTQTPMSRTNGSTVSCMYDGITIRNRGRERVYTSNNLGELQQYGYYIDANSDGTEKKGVPLVWCTHALEADGQSTGSWKEPRFMILSTGKKPAVNGPRVSIAGDAASSVSYTHLTLPTTPYV